MIDCIVCHQCGSQSLKIVNSRNIETLGFYTKRRRRKCLECGSRYNTLEIPEHFLSDVFGEET